MPKLQDFSFFLSTTRNIQRIKIEYPFMEYVELTDTLAVVPFTEDFYTGFWSVADPARFVAGLEGTSFEEFILLEDYSNLPIILYTVQYKYEMGGRGDEAWLFRDGKLVKKYFEESARIGVVLDQALKDSELDLGKLKDSIHHKIHVHPDAAVSFYTLGLESKFVAEDFFMK